ncbi:MAG TPA: prepilin peptidase, partial [Terracidiphilus sp.]|nr:prepilin peptidase [Terracidiphilus sp.]
MIRILGTILAALTGLAFGSFLNVCLSRWPEGESIVQPRSHCRQCGHTLAWWENIPLLSWLALRGRCRNCRAWIGWRYPLVEVTLGTLWAIAVWQFMGKIFDLNLPANLLYFELASTLGTFI